MFSKGFHLFSVRGIPIELNISWILILILVTWSFATGYIPENYPGVFSVPVTWVLSFLTAILLFISILLHELSHSLVAVRNGLPIRRITLFMFGGVAQMSREVDDPGLELRMAAAGPFLTIVLAGMLFLLSLLTGRVLFLSVLLRTLANINLGVFIFNMIPGFPLDGGRILRAAIWWRRGDLIGATRVASNIGSAFAYLLVFAGTMGFIMYRSMIGGLWMVFIGLFLLRAARDSYRNVLYQKVLSEMKVDDIMRREVLSVDPSIDLMTLVNEYFLRYHYGAFPVVREGALVGMVTLSDVQALDRLDWSSTEVGEVMDTAVWDWAVHPTDSSMRLFMLVIQKGRSLVPVALEDGRIVGMVTRRDFSEAIKVMTSLLR